MKNKVVKKLMMIVMAATMLSGFSFATVYANADPPAEETTTEVVAETSSEATTEENTEDTGRVIAESDSSAFSTPGMHNWSMIRKMMIQSSSLPSRQKREILFIW